jgi:hypothetical protein
MEGGKYVTIIIVRYNNILNRKFILIQNLNGLSNQTLYTLSMNNMISYVSKWASTYIDISQGLALHTTSLMLQRCLLAVSFTGSIKQIWRLLSLSSLPLLPSRSSNAVFKCVSYPLLSFALHNELECGLFRLPDLKIALMAGVISRQGMLAPPRYLILPLACSGVSICPFLWFVLPTRFIRCSLYIHVSTPLFSVKKYKR